jgi:hypothetical protein
MKYHDVLKELSGGGAREWACEVLDRVSQGRSSVAGIRHPLGFVCLPLERDRGYGVCLHIWSGRLPPVTPTTSQVHSHSWDLVSHVLYGQVRNVHALVTDAPRGEDPTHRVFRVSSSPDEDHILPTPRTVRYAEGRVDAFGPGDTYTLDAGVFHSSVIPAETATIALGKDRHGCADLSLGPLTTPVHQVTRARFDRGATAHAARLARRNL